MRDSRSRAFYILTKSQIRPENVLGLLFHSDHCPQESVGHTPAGGILPWNNSCGAAEQRPNRGAPSPVAGRLHASSQQVTCPSFCFSPGKCRADQGSGENQGEEEKSGVQESRPGQGCVRAATSCSWARTQDAVPTCLLHVLTTVQGTLLSSS